MTELYILGPGGRRTPDPVSLYRLITFFAALAAMLRCGAEAPPLWRRDLAAPSLTARVFFAKRWIDPLAMVCGFLWMMIVMLGEPGKRVPPLQGAIAGGHVLALAGAAASARRGRPIKQSSCNACC
ncbi:hypothetical protein Q4F19_07850 [Sphingomonas sp. BIUV-7]|uniref:Uncharacterized protein n=1 Tax=Sphingomonas natans TaxID=3063330 RepID=A0ABT8Y7J7_9SPHN|nr:hypothetical protein [Sphingomonas sp. BIUV-7]MDO6414293.1 hypothetical protein [Sphingomonas sp. BIUV-7]